jgi:hypothetical protein
LSDYFIRLLPAFFIEKCQCIDNFIIKNCQCIDGFEKISIFALIYSNLYYGKAYSKILRKIFPNGN